MEGLSEHCTEHPISGLIGNTRYHYPSDLQHVGCLGVCQTVNGSCLAELVEDGPAEGSKEQRTLYYHRLIKRFCKQLGIPLTLNRLVPGMFFNPNGWNSLKSKAAESQQLVLVMGYVLEEVHDGNEHHEHRLRLVRSLAAIYKIFKDHELFLPREEADRALQLYDTLCEHWSWLLRRAISLDQPNWAFKQKLHCLYHLIYLARFLNPRFHWCYQFEDYMGMIVTIARKCTASTPTTRVGSKVMENLLLTFAFALEQH